MMTPVIYVGGDPYVPDSNGDLVRQQTFFCKSTDCTIDGNGIITDFPGKATAHNADPIYLMDTKAVYMFDEDTKTGLPQ